MKQIRRYLISRDKRILELLLGSDTQDPLPPKQIAIRLSISPWCVYRRIAIIRERGLISDESERRRA